MKIVADYGGPNAPDPHARDSFKFSLSFLGNNLTAKNSSKEQIEDRTKFKSFLNDTKTNYAICRALASYITEPYEGTLQDNVSYYCINTLAKGVFGLPPVDRSSTAILRKVSPTLPFPLSSAYKTMTKKVIEEDKRIVSEHAQDIIENNRYAAAHVNHLNSDEEKKIALIKSTPFSELFAESNVSALVTAGLIWVSLNPEILEKLQNELQEANVFNLPIEEQWNKLKNLPYLDRIYLETTRHLSPIPIIPRTLSKPVDVALGPEGEKKTIRLNRYALLFTLPRREHHNPKTWKNPDVFDPDRFQDETLKSLLNAFSTGARSCPTQAVMTPILYKTALAHVFSQYTLEFDRNIDFTIPNDAVTPRLPEVRVEFKPRASSMEKLRRV